MVANSSLNPRHFLPNIRVSTDKTASGFEGVLIGLICDVLFSYSMYLLEPNTELGLVSLLTLPFSEAKFPQGINVCSPHRRRKHRVVWLRRKGNLLVCN